MKCSEFTAGSPRSLTNCGRRIPTIRAWPITCPSAGPHSPCSARGAWFTPKFARSSRRPRIPSCGTARCTSKRALRFREPIDGPTAVSLAESFAAQAPGDKRAGELLHLAGHRLGVDWSTLVVLAAVFAIVAGLFAATIGMRRWLKYVLRMGVVLLAVFAVALAGLFFLANDTLIAIIRDASEKIGNGTAVAMVPSRLLSPPRPSQLRALAGTFRAAFAVMLAALCAVFLVVARRRFAEPPTRWPSAIRLGILTFFAVLAAFCAVDACAHRLPAKCDSRANRPGLSRLVQR